MFGIVWKIDSLDIYKGIRRMAAIYNASGGDAIKAIDKFCKDTGCKPETAADYLEQAVGIRARQTLFHKIVCQKGAFTPIGNPEPRE